MIIYNQMLYLKTQSQPKLKQQPIKQKNLDDNDSLSHQVQKQDETTLIKPISSKQTKKQSKALEKKAACTLENVKEQKQETVQKKKIFLSMMDIKKAQYRKFKIIEENNQKKPIAVVYDHS
ncbi:unnamed protein product (macronuclear) [Paramecium tetraurelia]|uniref:Uncharacterized protein n=1 Tax=Paramecium tetraurelia TaxID=5888 RepID=A0BD95_PARTE|nr:uncharacterized protein GSPATT00004606001 [Paramecium tetraurelia]CAK56512.1 unnamed protein product [Paramecium tetraurelia]|eukprot:XP_001423910.1 hypothetical protein (macronuclear) [Paramecium tetraurelia strain d4-2]